MRQIIIDVRLPDHCRLSRCVAAVRKHLSEELGYEVTVINPLQAPMLYVVEVMDKEESNESS